LFVEPFRPTYSCGYGQQDSEDDGSRRISGYDAGEWIKGLHGSVDQLKQASNRRIQTGAL